MGDSWLSYGGWEVQKVAHGGGGVGPSWEQGWASVLFKRTFRSLRSFSFFIKERNDLCVLFRSL